MAPALPTVYCRLGVTVWIASHTSRPSLTCSRGQESLLTLLTLLYQLLIVHGELGLVPPAGEPVLAETVERHVDADLDTDRQGDVLVVLF